MPAFKDEHIIIIAPGSQTTLAQLGLPESFTPARLRVKSRMFPAPKQGEFEATRITKKLKSDRQQPAAIPKSELSLEANGAQAPTVGGNAAEPEEEYEEDLLSDEGAIWPIQAGKIVDWPCFFALMQHVHDLLNGPFHTPILLIAQPCWMPKEHERVAQFFFEKFKCPAFALMDAASATCYAFAQPTATVVDIGLDKADVTAVSDFAVDSVGRTSALKGCGGEGMTQRLHRLLSSKGFSVDMCEQLKKSGICEILPPGTPLPGSDRLGVEPHTNPAAAASTGVNGSGPAPSQDASNVSDVPQGPGPNTAIGDGQRDEEDNEGVLDVASIVTGGKMDEYLAHKEKEKAEKAAARKKGVDATASQAKGGRLRNAERERNSFYFEDRKLTDTLKNSDMSADQIAQTSTTLDEGPKRAQPSQTSDVHSTQAHTAATTTSPTATTGKPSAALGPIRREISVGVERFQPHTGDFMVNLTSAIHKTIQAYPDPSKRSAIWDNLLIVGNGSRIRGFKEALVAQLQARFMISPSSVTMFTSEIPSAFSTPNATGANTPLPGMGMQQRANPLLYAATTASGQALIPPGLQSTPGPPQSMQPLQFGAAGHASQSPSSIKSGKLPEYFPEWKDAGQEEAAFLGAQVAAKVIFITDTHGGTSKGFMSRSDYNESGPEGIHGFSL